jgi:hypothetical protein
VPSFDKLRHRSNDQDVLLIAFDLLELDGNDLRREPLEVRKQTLASLLRGSLAGCSSNAHFTHRGDAVFEHACKMGLEGIVSKRLAFWPRTRWPRTEKTRFWHQSATHWRARLDRLAGSVQSFSHF